MVDSKDERYSIVERFSKLYVKDNKSGEIVSEPHPADSKFTFMKNVAIVSSPDGIISLYRLGDKRFSSFQSCCTDLRKLPNGNLVIESNNHFYVYNDKIGDISRIPLDSVGDFSYDQESDSYFAIARIDTVSNSGERANISFYVKIDMDGSFVSPLYNAITEEIIPISDGTFTFCDEVDKTAKYVMAKRKRMRETVHGLPLTKPVKIEY